MSREAVYSIYDLRLTTYDLKHHPFEDFRVLKVSLFTKLYSHPCHPFLPLWLILNLTLVLFYSLQFLIQSLCNIDKKVGVLRKGKVDLMGGMGIKPYIRLCRQEEMISGGNYSIGCCKAHCPAVRVQKIWSPRVMGYYNMGLVLTDKKDQFASKSEVYFQFPIPVGSCYRPERTGDHPQGSVDTPDA